MRTQIKRYLKRKQARRVQEQTVNSIAAYYDKPIKGRK